MEFHFTWPGDGIVADSLLSPFITVKEVCSESFSVVPDVFRFRFSRDCRKSSIGILNELAMLSSFHTAIIDDSTAARPIPTRREIDSAMLARIDSGVGSDNHRLRPQCSHRISLSLIIIRFVGEGEALATHSFKKVDYLVRSQSSSLLTLSVDISNIRQSPVNRVNRVNSVNCVNCVKCERKTTKKRR